MPDHFGFTKLVVADLERAAAFYGSVFGLEEQYRLQSQIAGRPIEETLYRATAPDAGVLVLLRYTDTDTDAATNGEVILGFRTDDIHALFDRATAAGGSVAQEVAESPEHGVLVGFLRDAEGHLIEVVQPR